MRIGFNPNASLVFPFLKFFKGRLELDGIYRPKPASLSAYFEMIGYSYKYSCEHPTNTIDFIKFNVENYATLNGVRYPLWIPFKCGHCSECVRDYVNDYKMRANLEAAASKGMYFFDLTYSNENLPENNSLCREHLSEFFRDIRSACQRLPQDSPFYGIKFRFVAVGEYGSRTGRPHYHVLCFSNQRVSLMKILELKDLLLCRWISPYYYIGQGGKRVYVHGDDYERALCCGNVSYSHNLSTMMLHTSVDGVPSRVRLFKNPKYRGYITKFEECQNCGASARYIMKYIAKNKLDECDGRRYYSPDEQIPPFLYTPRSSALGAPALDDPQIVENIMNSQDGTFNVLINGQVSKLSITPFIRERLCRSLGRTYPRYGLIVEVLRCYCKSLLDNFDVCHIEHQFRCLEPSIPIEKYLTDEEHALLDSMPDLFEEINDKPKYAFKDKRWNEENTDSLRYPNTDLSYYLSKTNDIPFMVSFIQRYMRYFDIFDLEHYIDFLWRRAKIGLREPVNFKRLQIRHARVCEQFVNQNSKLPYDDF